ncbi:MAG: hypothetical protein ACREKL_13300, partial [Chthoniobacterales bacterium]
GKVPRKMIELRRRLHMLHAPMKTALAAVSLATILLAACEPESRPHHTTTPPGQTGDTPTPMPTPDPGLTPTPSPTPDPGMTPTPAPSPMAGSPENDIPYARPVPGKPGYVISPYSNQGLVNVEGLAPNSLARCPYTKKVFRVP